LWFRCFRVDVARGWYNTNEMGKEVAIRISSRARMVHFWICDVCDFVLIGHIAKRWYFDWCNWCRLPIVCLIHVRCGGNECWRVWFEWYSHHSSKSKYEHLRISLW